MSEDAEKGALAQMAERLSERLSERLLWRGPPPRPAWHSFDRTPWRHPWLKPANLRRARQFSDRILAQAARIAQRAPRQFDYGFVCNMANALYERAVPLRKQGMRISLFPHPQDRFVMSQPEWEEYDGTLAQPADFDALVESGVDFPAVQGVKRYSIDPTCYLEKEQILAHKPAFVRTRDALRFPNYVFYNSSLIQGLQCMDALLAVQAPYLAYLSGKPYLVAQTGGEIWYECSRDDELGKLQRDAYAGAYAFLVSNPWSYAHARRYGLHKLVYVPMILDEQTYAPGESRFRDAWKRATNGDFFVLSTSRLDDLYKGTGLALDGFARFAARHPGARLVLLDWGADRERHFERLSGLGIADKVMILPLSGKRRVIEYLRAADCLIDQFVLGYYGATALEAMACGLPVVMRLEAEQYGALCEGGPPPVLNRDSVDGIAQALDFLAVDEPRRLAIGEAHRRWFLENHSAARWGAAYANLLAAAAMNAPLKWRASPLRARLSKAERTYQSRELEHAPVFPRYH